MPIRTRSNHSRTTGGGVRSIMAIGCATVLLGTATAWSQTRSGPSTDPSERLGQSDGVIRPRQDVDPKMPVRPPAQDQGKTPVIPPPGSPGGDPSVVPK